MHAQWVEVPDSVYVPDQLIVWFRPGVLNLNYLGCDTTYNPLAGLPINSNFILDGNILSYLQQIGAVYAEKIIPNLTPCSDTVSISRRGDFIQIPDFWNMLLIHFDPEKFHGNIPNLAIAVTMYFQNSIKIAEPNYVADFLGEKPKQNAPMTYDPNDVVFHTLRKQRSIMKWDPQNGMYGTDVDLAWDRTKGSPNIIVGVADAGIAGAGSGVPQGYGHPDFGSTGEVVLGGYNYLAFTGTYWIQAQHGTQVASIIGAKTHNEIYIAGIAGGSGNNDNVKLVALNIGGSPHGTLAALTSALIEGATKKSTSPIVGAWGCDLIVTATGPFDGQAPECLRAATAYVYNNDVLLSIAFGNSGNPRNPQNPEYPQDLDDDWVMAVGGAFNTGRFTNSDYGEYLDVLAPWFNAALTVSYTPTPVFSATGLGNTPPFEGTSSATPHATGIAALLLSYRETIGQSGWDIPAYLAPEDIVFLLGEGSNMKQIPAQPFFPVQKDLQFGYGIVDAENTLQLIDNPFNLKHIEIQPESVTIQDSVLIDSVVIAFPGNYVCTSNADTLFTVMQYHVVMHGLQWTSPFGNGDLYPGIIRCWGRGGASLGFPDIRRITKTLAGSNVVAKLPLYRNTGWNRVDAFSYDRCDIETYIYRIKRWPRFGASTWEWLGGIDPSKVKFAVSVVHDTRIISGIEPRSSITGLQLSSPYPNPITSDRIAYSSIVMHIPERSTISVSIIDVLGREIQNLAHSQEFDAGNHILNIPVSLLPQGMYVIRASTVDQVTQTKLVILR